ncbi:hypothetical protein AOLI_G00273420 [Acnodon oligacanthus]
MRFLRITSRTRRENMSGKRRTERQRTGAAEIQDRAMFSYKASRTVYTMKCFPIEVSNEEPDKAVDVDPGETGYCLRRLTRNKIQAGLVNLCLEIFACFLTTIFDYSWNIGRLWFCLFLIFDLCLFLTSPFCSS